MKSVLVVDDEREICEVLSDILKDEGYRVHTALDGVAALEVLDTEVVHCLILDVWLPGKGGLEVLEDVRRDFPAIPVIVISGHGSIDMAVKAVKNGAFDFVEKPLSLDRITTLVRNALELGELRRENQELRTSLPPRKRIVGQAASIESVRAMIDQSAGTDATILITGENGTGKELVAREIHDRSARRTRPFVAVNCAAIPDTLIESELFGHERGAFTSAEGRRQGKFEQANGGTLFLDEIADMSLSAQAKVLRVIQEMRFERLGAEDSIEVDVRIMAATNKVLTEEIASGTFREDLYFRLHVVPIELPALRDRKEDIPLLVAAFLEEADRSDDVNFAPGALAVLGEHEWPGNIRELKNLVERVTILEAGSTIDAEGVRRHMQIRDPAPRSNGLSSAYGDLGLNEARDRFEKEYLEESLRRNKFNISRAAEDLGIYPSSLHAKIKKFGIRVKR